MVGSVFFTKKQKKQMQLRRTKKRSLTDETLVDEELTKKRKLNPDIESQILETSSENERQRIVVVPADLDPKAAHKFRKEMRRKAKKDGIDVSLLNFVVDGQSNDSKVEEAPEGNLKNGQSKRLPKKSFPSINQILKEKEEEKEKLLQAAKLSKSLDALPESYKSKYVAIDCEMVGIGSEGRQSALARVSVVDWYGAVLLDTFVKVPARVTDFRTHVSGVKANHITSKAAMEVTTCREQVSALIKGKILVGHALKNDLQALLLQHPKDDIRDTAMYRPFQRVVGTKWRPRKLRELVKQHLGKDIQIAGQAHDSVEDAKSALELFQHVRDDWEKSLNKSKFGKKS
jgi:RNA exonuclease 4